jgi:hypothetical protein
VDSPWQVPLPRQEQATSRVVVYFDKGGWIPITFYPLVDAIQLHRIALSSGMDIVVFPPDLDPRFFDTPLIPSHAPREGQEKPELLQKI